MRKLLLLRHAKSSHKDTSLDDFDRPLAKRGRKDCKRVGKYLASEGLIPDLVISSTAIRTKETTERVCKRLDYDLERVQWEPTVYQADLLTLQNIIELVHESHQTVMLVGHHEGLTSLVLGMSKWADIPADPKLIPTGGVAKFKVDGDWTDFRKSKVRLKGIVRPRELAAAESTD